MNRGKKQYNKVHRKLCTFYAYSDKYRDPNYIYRWRVFSVDEAAKLARMYGAKGGKFWVDGIPYQL